MEIESQEILYQQIQSLVVQYNQNNKQTGQSNQLSLESHQERENALQHIMNAQKELKRYQTRKSQIDKQLTQNRCLQDSKDKQNESGNQNISDKMIKEENEQLIQQPIKQNTKKIRHQYSFDEKVTVVEYAIKYNTEMASQLYKIPFETIKQWRSLFNKGKDNLRDNRSNNSRPTKYPQLEDELIKEILQFISKGIPISFLKVIQLSNQISKRINISNFKASNQWVYHFFKRKSISLRKKTTNYQIDQTKMKQRTIKFIQLLEKEKFYQNFDLLINFDETAFMYSNNKIYTYEIKGTQSISISNNNQDKKKVTVGVTIGVETKNQKGFIFQPFIILKNQSKNPWTITHFSEQFHDKCYITHSPSGWQNNSTMLEYCNFLIKQIKQQFDYNNRKTLLIMDTFKCHQYQEALQLLEKNQISIAYIPGGLTAIFQPIDVAINKPLKSYMKNKYIEYQFSQQDVNKNSNNINNNNPSINNKNNDQEKNIIKLPQQSTFIQWICDSHANISSNTVIPRSFGPRIQVLELIRE